MRREKGGRISISRGSNRFIFANTYYNFVEDDKASNGSCTVRSSAIPKVAMKTGAVKNNKKKAMVHCPDDLEMYDGADSPR